MSVNRVQLLGNVGNAPIVREVGETKVANFNLATTKRGYKRSDGTQVAEKTEWHRIVVWGSLANIVQNYVGKGEKLFVEGELYYRNYEKEGVTHTVAEIFAQNIELLGGRNGGNNQSQAQAPAQAPAQKPEYPIAPPSPQVEVAPATDDGLPF